MLIFCLYTFTTRYDLPGWSQYTIICEIVYHAVPLSGECAVFQERPRVFRGGLEVLLRQSDHDRSANLKSRGFRHGKSSSPRYRSPSAPAWYRSRYRPAQRWSWWRIACSPSSQCKSLGSHTCGRGTSRREPRWSLSREARRWSSMPAFAVACRLADAR
jgi:hypothetical protein